MPRSTTNRRGTVEGDPLNLVVIGDFDTILNGFGARWDETETISLAIVLADVQGVSCSAATTAIRP